MFDYPLLPRVFPFGAILFDFLFLLVAIPIEASVLNARLRFDKKTSAFYAISMNLFSSAIGWTTFFLVEPFLPINLRSELISYVFFNRFQSTDKMYPIVSVSAIIIFFTTFLLKYLLLKALLISLSEPGEVEEEPQPQPRRSSRRPDRKKLQNTSLVTTTLIANSLSYSAIVIVILIQKLSNNS